MNDKYVKMTKVGRVASRICRPDPCFVKFGIKDWIVRKGFLLGKKVAEKMQETGNGPII